MLLIRTILLVVLTIGAMTMAPAPPAQSREQNAAATGGCPCDGNSDVAKKRCQIACEIADKMKATKTTGAVEAPAAEQVCCRITRGFRFSYNWTTPAQCKPPQRTVMATAAKCPLQRSQ